MPRYSRPTADPNQGRFPTRVEIEPNATNGLRDTCYARCEDIRSAGDRRMVHRIGLVDIATMLAVGRVIRTFLEL